MKRIWAAFGFALVGIGTWIIGVPVASAVCGLAIIGIAASFMRRER